MIICLIRYIACIKNDIHVCVDYNTYNDDKNKMHTYINSIHYGFKLT